MESFVLEERGSDGNAKRARGREEEVNLITRNRMSEVNRRLKTKEDKSRKHRTHAGEKEEEANTKEEWSKRAASQQICKDDSIVDSIHLSHFRPVDPLVQVIRVT